MRYLLTAPPRYGDALQPDADLLNMRYLVTTPPRYGDALQPDADLLAMRGAWRALRPHRGTLLLSAPVS